jgi:hypothetical protein
MFFGKKFNKKFEDEIAAKYGRKIKTLPFWLI